MLEVKDATIAVGEQLLAERLSFTARDGELTCVTGPASSGKTVLLRTLMGFLPVREGFVSVDGELLTLRSSHVFRSLMLYLPQQMQQLRHQLCEPEAPQPDAESFGVWNQLLPQAVEVEQPEPLSPEEIFQLAQDELCRGAEKPIVIADEPAALLPPELGVRMLELLRREAEAGKTVLVASRLPLIVDHADLVIEMKKLNSV